MLPSESCTMGSAKYIITNGTTRHTIRKGTLPTKGSGMPTTLSSRAISER